MSEPNEKNNDTREINIDPAVLLDCLDEVNALVNAHVQILFAVKTLLTKFLKSGMSHEDAAAAALTLHKRAADKASSLVPNSEPEELEVAEAKAEGDEMMEVK